MKKICKQTLAVALAVLMVMSLTMAASATTYYSGGLETGIITYPGTTPGGSSGSGSSGSASGTSGGGSTNIWYSWPENSGSSSGGTTKSGSTGESSGLETGIINLPGPGNLSTGGTGNGSSAGGSIMWNTIPSNWDWYYIPRVVVQGLDMVVTGDPVLNTRSGADQSNMDTVIRVAVMTGYRYTLTPIIEGSGGVVTSMTNSNGYFTGLIPDTLYGLSAQPLTGGSIIHLGNIRTKPAPNTQTEDEGKGEDPKQDEQPKDEAKSADTETVDLGYDKPGDYYPNLTVAPDGTVFASANPSRNEKSLSVKEGYDYDTSTSIYLATNSKCEYSIDQGAHWQDSGLFTGLKPSTAYTFWMRLKATPTNPVGNVISLGIIRTDEDKTVEVEPYLYGSDGKVRPTDKVTRAEAVALFYRTLGVGETKVDDVKFADVLDGKWYAEDINALARTGIVAGYGDGTFHPDDYMTRAQFASILTRYSNTVKGEASKVTLKDIDGHWAKKNILTAVESGWIYGDPEGYFHPDAPVSRAEAIAMLNRALGKRTISIDVTMLSGLKVWDDLNNPKAWYYKDLLEAGVAHKEKVVNGAVTWTALVTE